MGNNIKEAVERGKEMERIQQNLNKTEADYITQQAKLRKEFEQQKKLSDDTTKSNEEREKAAERAIQLQEEISKGSIERIKQEAEILRMKQMSNDTSDQERADLARKLAEIDKALEEEAAKTTEAQNKLNAIRKEAATQEEAQAKALAEKRQQYAEQALNDLLQKKEEEIAYFKESQKFNEDRLKVLELSSAMEVDLLKTKLKNNLISEREYQTEVLAIENEIKAKKAEEREAELQRIQNFEDRKRELEEQIRLANAESEIERAQLKAEQDFEKRAREIEALQITEAEKTELLALIETQRQQVLTDIQTEFEEQRLEKFKQIMSEELAVRKQNAQEVAGIAQQLAGILSGLLGDTLGAKLASIAIDAAIQAGMVQITTSASQAQNLAMANAAGPVASLALTPIALAQNAALQANSAKAITKILASAAIKGVGASIKSLTAPKAEQGIVMDLNGPSHSQGGINLFDESGKNIVNAQGGEKMVILKREASRELDMLSQLNQKHGGVPLSRPVSYAANGGAIIRNPQASSSVRIPRNLFDYNALGDVLADRVNAIVPVVPVDSVTNIANKTARVERAADLN